MQIASSLRLWKSPFLTLLALSVFAGGTAGAADDAVYRYDYATGSLTATYDFSGGFSHALGPNAPSAFNGATFGDLISSGRAWGTGHSSLIKAFDWVQNFRVNYLTEDGTATWYYGIDENDNGHSGSPRTEVFVDGPFAGQAILGNQHLLALDDERVLLYNPAATGNDFLALYTVDAGEMSFAPFGFTAFSGTAPASGQTFASQLGRFIGAENGRLYYLDPDGSFSAYNILTGETVWDPTWTQFSGGLMDGLSLEDAFTGGHYLGIGNGPDFYFTASVIPEPSTSLLLGTAILMTGVATLKRRR